MKLTKRLAILGVASVLTLGASGIAIAAIPDANDGEIHACRANGDAGTIRIIDKEAGKSCHSYESEIVWDTTPGLSGREVVTDTTTLDYGEKATATANCPSGKTVVGGGHHVGTGANVPDVWFYGSRPVDNAGVTGWEVTAKNRNQAGTQFTAYAVCVTG